MIVDISLHCVGLQRPEWGTLVRLPRTLSLMFPYSRRVMIMLRRSLYGVVYDGRVLGIYVPLPPAVLTGFPQVATISLDAGFGRIVFLSAVFVVFHSRYQSTLIPVPPSIGRREFKGFPLTLCFLVLRAGSSPGPYTQCGSGVPSEMAAVRWRCFPGRSALLPKTRALSARKS